GYGRMHCACRGKTNRSRTARRVDRDSKSGRGGDRAMKLGISTYSLHGAYKSGELTLEGVIETIAELGAEHAEIVPIGYNLVEQPELIEVIKQTANNAGLELSNYAIGANF